MEQEEEEGGGRRLRTQWGLKSRHGGVGWIYWRTVDMGSMTHFNSWTIPIAVGLENFYSIVAIVCHLKPNETNMADHSELQAMDAICISCKSVKVSNHRFTTTTLIFLLRGDKASHRDGKRWKYTKLLSTEWVRMTLSLHIHTIVILSIILEKIFPDHKGNRQKNIKTQQTSWTQNESRAKGEGCIWGA